MVAREILRSREGYDFETIIRPAMSFVSAPVPRMELRGSHEEGAHQFIPTVAPMRLLPSASGM